MQWGEHSQVSIVGKRLRDEETSEPRKKPALDFVDSFPPHEGHHWYLGGNGDKLFLRPCVRDLASLVLNRALERKETDGPALFIISGASGIGKSWSINVFMTELLRAGKKVFFHCGATGLAWEIQNANTLSPARLTSDIGVMDSQWLYLYDSPGAKSNTNSQAVPRRGKGQVTLIFASPKHSSYGFAYSKSNGTTIIFNLPTWKLEEMLKVKGKEHREAVCASYGIWGGNMRALDKFIENYKSNPGEAKQIAEAELASQIARIDPGFIQKMTNKLETQEVDSKFSDADVQDSPGRILTPEPMVTDPNAAGCFQEFQWRFCSPLAEKKFFERVKKLDGGFLKELLIKVFEAPSAKGVLFEKLSHLLITDKVDREFMYHPYNNKKDVKRISFPACGEVIDFATNKLKDKLKEAFGALSAKARAIPLQPLDTSFDAVDMFLLVRTATTGSCTDFTLYMIQDTIAKKHSFHPVKVLWYCSLFCDVYKEIFPTVETMDSDLLNCCKYVPIVPKRDPFSFETATSTSGWNEVRRVKDLLGFQWPDDFQNQLSANSPDWEHVQMSHNLTIPRKTRGDERSLTKAVVGNALLLKESDATARVEQACDVIFDVVPTWQTNNSV